MSKDKKSVNKEVSSNIDSIWNHWLDGVKKLNQAQTEVEKQSFEAYQNLEELLAPTIAWMKKAEKDSAVFTEQVQEQFQSVLNVNDNVGTYWIDEGKKVNNQFQDLFWRSNNTFFEALKQSQKQCSANVETALEQQQKGRTEMVNTIEQMVEQIKATQIKAAEAK